MATIIVAATALVLCATPALAGVTTTTTTNYHRVSGTTAKAVVRSMQSNPIRGDHGSAFANIRPRYTLTTTTKEKGGQCRASRVDVKIHFTLTLPEAADKARMSKKTRNAWNAFVTFARGHEEHHRQSYIGCAKRFVTAAQGKSAKSCFAVESDIRRLFDDMKRDCEAKQVAWDRTQRGVVLRQSLIRMAGY